MNSIHFVGYSAVHPADFVFEFPQGDCYLLLLITTPAEFLVDGVVKEYPANSAILYAPGQKVYYRACTDTYQNDWIRFYSDETFVTGFPVTGVPFPVSDTEYCHNLFKLLTWESSFGSPESDLIISHLLRVLFFKLYEDTKNRNDNQHAADLLSLRKKIYNTPQWDWTLDEMASQLHLSVGYLQIIYKKTFGVSCMDDVIEGRIRLAKEKLINTKNPIHEVAEACGYHNVEHFCRQYKKITGITPGSFRKTMKNNVSDSRIIHHSTVSRGNNIPPNP